MPTGYPSSIGAERYDASMNRWWVKTEQGWRLRAVVVMEKKLGRPIPKGYDVHHKDENPTNDHPNNLELKTHSGHARHHFKGKRRGENNPAANLTWKKVKKMRRQFDKGVFTQAELMRRFKVSRTNVCLIVNRKLWVKP
jgi:hypothetical protein